MGLKAYFWSKYRPISKMDKTKLLHYKTIRINTAATHLSDTSILVIYTGGTIGMDYSPNNGKYLIPFDFSQIIEKVPELKRFDFELTVLAFDELLDSSNIQPHHWLTLASVIETFYEEYDAFVILHGTDTMAYSASALSFLLENLAKPVIFTGAQLPIAMRRTDARDNLISALEIAALKNENETPRVPEVCIFFDNMLLRGNRSKKVQTNNFTAFRSENYPPLASAGVTIEFNESITLPVPQEKFFSHTKIEADVFLIKLFPGMNYDYLEHLISIDHMKGLVLETYGSGNAPTDKRFTEILERAIQNGIIICNVSQCSGGRVTQGKYETSSILEKIGVIGGGDMTTETALTKLMFLLANENSQKQIRRLLKKNLRGEMS